MKTRKSLISESPKLKLRSLEDELATAPSPTGEEIQDILNPLTYGEDMDFMIDAFVSYYGEKYRPIITKKLKEINIVSAPNWSAKSTTDMVQATDKRYEDNFFDSLYSLLCDYRVIGRIESVSEELKIANIIVNIAEAKKENSPHCDYFGSKLISYDKERHAHGWGYLFRHSYFDYTSDTDANYNDDDLIRFSKLEKDKKEKIFEQAILFEKDLDELIAKKHPFLNRYFIAESVKLMDRDQELRGKKSAEQEACLKRFYDRCENLIDDPDINVIMKHSETFPEQVSEMIESFTNAKNSNNPDLLVDLINRASFRGLLKIFGVKDKQLDDKEFLSALLFDESYAKNVGQIDKEIKNIKFENPIAKSAIERVKGLGAKNVNYLKSMISNAGNTMGSACSFTDNEGKDLSAIMFMFDMENSTFIHEMNHCLNMRYEANFPNKGVVTYYSGFARHGCFYKEEEGEYEEKETDNKKTKVGQYTGLNEVINELITQEICKIIVDDPNGDLEDYEEYPLYDRNFRSSSAYQDAFPIYQEFFHKHKDLINEYLMSDNPTDIKNIVGEASFNKLAKATNGVLYEYNKNDDKYFDMDDLMKLINKKYNKRITTYQGLINFCKNLDLKTIPVSMFTYNEYKYIECVKNGAEAIAEMDLALEQRANKKVGDRLITSMAANINNPNDNPQGNDQPNGESEEDLKF